MPATIAALKPSAAKGIAEALEGRDLLAEMGRRIEPAEALGDPGLDVRVARPQRGIAIEQARGPDLGPGALGGGRPQLASRRREPDPAGMRCRPGTGSLIAASGHGSAAWVDHARRSAASIARTLSTRRRWRGSLLNVAPR